LKLLLKLNRDDTDSTNGNSSTQQQSQSTAAQPLTATAAAIDAALGASASSNPAFSDDTADVAALDTDNAADNDSDSEPPTKIQRCMPDSNSGGGGSSSSSGVVPALASTDSSSSVRDVPPEASVSTAQQGSK
jgi:hypothetical protein